MPGLDPVADTALLTAALRGRESTRPDRLFDDPLAAVLAGDAGRELIEEFGDVPAIAVRTRYFDDLLTAVTTAEGGPRQLALLAAGMDTRAYRLPFPDGSTVFEADRPELLALKEKRLADAPAPRCRRVAVPVDLAADWPTALTAAGFRPGEPTCWLVEGLTQYLHEADVLRLFDRVTALSAPGSHLLTDFVSGELLRDPASRPMLDAMAERGAAWHYGTDDPEPLFSARGWRLERDDFAEVGRGLGRWPDEPVPSGHLVHAFR
ncbi:SAM-dependent methyltransferase [Streptomyces orinoci]|uniref:S-adenosyl-L-methionine-dependent methyltransferase n=1 Tax=Streptomyces orinoci TaxID=67339 RepID=A0ABV3JU63_STRON|nr:SAM-dependent methyltransferase [Streptomyces orinoci]